MNDTNAANQDTQQYDIILVGSSLLCCFEAIYQSKLGNKVLIIESADEIGGAWRTLQIFGLSNVENAIHYFLPNDIAIHFLSEKLGISIEISKKKFQIFQFWHLNYFKLPFDFRVTRVIARFFALKTEFPKSGRFNLLYRACSVFFKKRRVSFYPAAGSIEMLNKTISLLKKTDIEINFGTHISTLSTCASGECVEVATDRGLFKASQILITHGTIIKRYYSDGKKIPINNKIHRRPACHMLVDDKNPPRFYEAAFVDSKIIKYVHDITRYVNNSDRVIGRKKLLVFALHPHVQNTSQTRTKILKELQDARLIDCDSNLIKFHWSEVFLPPLDDMDLNNLEKQFNGLVKTMKTENFTRCVGENARKWEKIFVF